MILASGPEIRSDCSWQQPVLGIHNCLEITTTAVSDLFTYLGTEQNMALSALWRA
jgi:hypothetical protein